jgi:hypothetical protein
MRGGGRGKGGKLRRKRGEKGPTRVGTTIEVQLASFLGCFEVSGKLQGSSLN